MNNIAVIILKRLGLGVVTLFLVSMIVFSISSLLPGDAAQELLGQSATPEAVAALREQLGLNKSPFGRYFEWLFGLLMGNPGMSMTGNMPVSELIADRLPKSLILAGLTTVVSTPIAFAIGFFSAMYRGGRLDRILNVSTIFMIAVPEFLVATLAVLFFSVQLRWLPSITIIPHDATLGEFLRAYALPVMTLCFVVIAQMARMTRAAIIDQLNQPYVEMAILKGVDMPTIVRRHVLPNAIGPVANAFAFSLSYLLGGAIIVEIIFNYPGIASLMVNAVTSRDMPLLQTCAMIFCGVYLLLVLAADICAIFGNPKLRRS